MKPTPLLCACVLAVLASGPAAVQDVRATARFSRTDDVRAELCKRFESAKRTIDVAVFTFTDGKLADALAAASRRKGVTVRVLADFSQHTSGRDRHKEALRRLDRSAVTVKLVDLSSGRGDPKFQPRFHHKFCVIDGSTLITGSFNWTGLAGSKNHENVLILEGDTKTAAAYAKEFNDVWNSGRLTKSVP